MVNYIVYDGRALGGDLDDAGVLEAFSAGSDASACREARTNWSEYEYVLTDLRDRWVDQNILGPTTPEPAEAGEGE